MQKKTQNKKDAKEKGRKRKRTQKKKDAKEKRHKKKKRRDDDFHESRHEAKARIMQLAYIMSV